MDGHVRPYHGQLSKRDLREEPSRSRFLIVFDREGYSPELFKDMWEQHRIACITHPK